MEIKVLGGGCARCKKLVEDARQAVAQAGADAQVAYVSDMAEMLRYDIPSTPAIVIDGEVKAAGRLPGIPEIVAWIRDASAQDSTPKS